LRGEILIFLDADTRIKAGGLEKILQSYIRRGGLLSIWPYHLGAFGPCVACSKSDYFKVGGHEAVKGTISFRMYPSGIGSLIAGFSKGMASGAQVVNPKILIPIIFWVAGGFVASFWFLIQLLALNFQAAAPWTVFHVLYILQIHWLEGTKDRYQKVN
jgi:4,4'-diaponeurosporenoate glycosyltransferase